MAGPGASTPFMRAHQACFRVATMAHLLGVSTSRYYAWRRRPSSALAQSAAEFTARVQALHRRSRRTYGALRIHAELAEAGVAVSRKRVARVMRPVGLPWGEPAPPAPDLVDRDFAATRANQLWVADLTHICSSRSATSHQSSTKPRTISRSPPRRYSTSLLSGKPGAVHYHTPPRPTFFAQNLPDSS